jgi:hypothetical protein
MEVLSRVPILRVIAATDVPAGPAKSQMHPSIAKLEALLATATTWTIGSHEAQMSTLSRHDTATELEPRIYTPARSRALPRAGRGRDTRLFGLAKH